MASQDEGDGCVDDFDSKYRSSTSQMSETVTSQSSPSDLRTSSRADASHTVQQLEAKSVEKAGQDAADVREPPRENERTASLKHHQLSPLERNRGPTASNKAGRKRKRYVLSPSPPPGFHQRKHPRPYEWDWSGAQTLEDWENSEHPNGYDFSQYKIDCFKYMLRTVRKKDESVEDDLRVAMNARAVTGHAADTIGGHTGLKARGEAHRDEIERLYCLLEAMEAGEDIEYEEKQKLVAVFAGLYEEFHFNPDVHMHAVICKFASLAH